MESEPILVTGATGYVGGRLVPALLEAGFRVRAMARSPEKLGCRPWAGHPRVETVRGDALDRASLESAARGCRAAYYLVHSMIARGEEFARADRTAAHHMAAAAATAGLERIIYLGGLAKTDGSPLSRHLRSRVEVAAILQAGPVPATDLRAPMILGSGSASFEILRYLVERLPVMVTPRWVRSRCQPIAIRNVIAYLVGCLQASATAGGTYDIGGPDLLTYRDLLEIYTREAGLPRRLILPVPVLTPTLSALWIHLISPVPKSIALPLTQGLTSDSVCGENRIRAIIPQELLGCRETIRLALERTRRNRVDTCWMDAGQVLEPEWAHCGDAPWAGGAVMRCGYLAVLAADPREVWEPVQCIGGRTGWYYGNLLWRLRGAVDRLCGGVGLRRGRRHPRAIGVGDALDFWRVLEVDPGRRLLLSAEMKTPGEALLEFEVAAAGGGRTELRMLSRFLPRGLLGILYWYALYPFHQWVFSGMLGAIARRIGKPVLEGPRRFTPKLHDGCRL